MDDVVIVTGAGRGIGLGLASALLKAGYRVATFDIHGEGDDLLRSLGGNRALPQRCDVSDPDQVSQAVKRVIDQWGRIDILVNNAALCLFVPFEQRSVDDIRREFDINYFGYINAIRAVLPQMRLQGRGVIHNMSSTVGFTGFPELSGYASTKGAIESLTLTLALELRGSGISIGVMHPPLTATRSSEPLGIPAQMQEDPETVGRKLASRIMSRRPSVTAGFATSVVVMASRVFGVSMGRLLAGLTQRSRAAAGNLEKRTSPSSAHQ